MKAQYFSILCAEARTWYIIIKEYSYAKKEILIIIESDLCRNLYFTIHNLHNDTDIKAIVY